jgi:predicted alpha/beta superfamily hydrolase
MRVPPCLLALCFLARPAPAQQPPADSIPPHESFTLESRVLSETRRINVFTPPGYRAAMEERYPVLYMPDGGIKEDFPHVVNTLDSLGAAGLVRAFIVVGVENTERRRDMTGPTTVASDSGIARKVGGSAAFRQFIRDELMPEIRSRYRTTDETAIVGESLAGLFVMETFFLEPALFNRYLAMSPSVWWNDRELVRRAEERIPGLTGLNRALYFTVANECEIMSGTDELARQLHDHASPDLLWFYEPMPEQEHSTIYRAAAPIAFKRLLGRR